MSRQAAVDVRRVHIRPLFSMCRILLTVQPVAGSLAADSGSGCFERVAMVTSAVALVVPAAFGSPFGCRCVFSHHSQPDQILRSSHSQMQVVAKR